MRIADLVDFITGARPGFDASGAAVKPGDKFARYDERSGWTYVEIAALSDGRVREDCVYARAFSHEDPAGRQGYCYLSQLEVPIDDDAWSALRARNWPAPGVRLCLEPDRQALQPRPG